MHILIQVFRAIADHKIFHRKVTEIIWDDARFIKTPDLEGIHPSELDPVLGMDSNEGCPYWFVKECKKNITNLKYRKGQDVERPDHIARADQVAAQPSLRVCWQYYQNLLQQQEDVLVFKSDVDAFIYGLKRFPALKRVTITPAAHGWLFAPLYATPMIRAFPYGFNYPIPRGWPTSEDAQTPPYAYSWQDMNEEMKDQWRGFRIVTRVLAEQEHNITELICNVNQLPTGLNCTMFDYPCEEYDKLASLLKRPGFSHLDLPMIVRGKETVPWPLLRNGCLLRQALSEVKDIEYLRLWTSAEPDAIDYAILMNGIGSLHRFIPLQTFLPVGKWSKLRHFGLSRFPVIQSDLVSVLTALPETTRTIELGFLYFIHYGGSYYGLLTEIRDKFRWHERDVAARPKLIIGVPTNTPHVGVGTWIENEVHNFLYKFGPNPFFDHCSDYIECGVGVERDSFEPKHERPNAEYSTLVQMGYYRK
ncbi:hypothetical protein AWENTII_005893 [Aspergillus wentii]